MSLTRPKKSSIFVKLYLGVTFLIERGLDPFLLLAIRLWMARIFWNSGLTKIDSWGTTLLLFQDEYKVPYLPPDLAAYLATGTELVCPVLLVLGLMTRLSVVPMLIMTAVIQFTYLQANEHIYWAFLLGFLLCYGPGKVSLDYFLQKLTFLPAKRWRNI